MAVKNRTAADKKAILKEAHKRFKRCENYEATFRARFLDDIRFCEGDAYNMYQWPAEVQERLKSDNKVMLTINRTRQHVLDVLNDARQTKVAIKIRPVRGGASFESAQALEGICRHIEYISAAQSAYQHALKFAVQGGIGWWRLATDYIGDDSFDQEIFIRRIPDPMTVYLDPDITEFDGSDARFGFVFTTMPRDEYESQYDPKGLQKGRAGSETFGPAESWVGEDKVKIAEYFRVVQDKDRLIGFEHPETGEPITIRESEIKAADRELLKRMIDDPGTMIRNLPMPKVEHFQIVGDEITEEKEWPGRYIPLIRVIGEETVIDGEMDRKGHVRALLDQQRMANYNAPLCLETPLPTPNGWVKMGDVRPGDLLFDEHGKPAKVLGLSPTYLFRDCFRVDFDDGSHIIADGEHKWTVETRGKRVDGRTQWHKEDICTSELAPKRHYIWASKPLDGTNVPLPIDPYVLGVWLGNGNSVGGRITFHQDDAEEFAREFQSRGYAISAVRPYLNGSKACEFGVFGLISSLKAAGLFGNKHIPSIYLRASEAQRWELLQGLMDTDGSCTKKAQAVFASSNSALAEGVKELMRTLGIKPVVTELPAAKRIFPGGIERDCAPSFRFAFSPNADEPIFRLSRKKERQGLSRVSNPRRTKRHRIVSVTPVPSVPVRCLAIDTPTHLFLAGEGMIPTHNSASIEYGALQSKIPYVGPLEAFEGVEEVWADANVKNPAYLPFKHKDDDGDPIPAPQRQQPPQGAPIFQAGFQMAIEQMFLASGQNQADFGMPSNEKSGVAIQQRQRQGDNATYHYIDHQSTSITYTGKQLIDLIGKVYDTERVVKMRDEAGKESEISVDPNAPQPYQAQDVDQDKQAIVLNPRLGVYDVQADTGPAYATRRQEAFEAYTQILTQNRELTAIIGDIAMRFADFPGAEEAAARLRRMVPQQALSDGPPPDVMKLQQQIQAMEQLIGQLNDKLASKEADHMNDQEKNAVAGYDAQTKRIGALKDALGVDPDGLMMLVREVINEAIQTSGALAPALDGTPYVPTAEDRGAAPPAIPPPMPEGGAQPAAPGGTPAG